MFDIYLTIKSSYLSKISLGIPYGFASKYLTCYMLPHDNVGVTIDHVVLSPRVRIILFFRRFSDDVFDPPKLGEELRLISRTAAFTRVVLKRTFVADGR